MENISFMLKEKNLKLTPQRLAIFSMLYNTNIHPTAEMIYQSLAQSHPSMSFATVYKTLDSLKKADLIIELNVGEDSFRYDANCNNHMHFFCKECHKVYDIPTNSYVFDVVAEIKSTTDFEIHREQFFFNGICPDCKKDN